MCTLRVHLVFLDCFILRVRIFFFYSWKFHFIMIFVAFKIIFLVFFLPFSWIHPCCSLVLGELWDWGKFHFSKKLNSLNFNAWHFLPLKARFTILSSMIQSMWYLVICQLINTRIGVTLVMHSLYYGISLIPSCYFVFQIFSKLGMC